MKFIRMIIEILLFYYIFKFIAKLILPILAKKTIEKAGANFQKKHQNNSQNQTNFKEKEGVILDDSKVEKRKKTNNKTGEYVDFEEIN